MSDGVAPPLPYWAPLPPLVSTWVLPVGRRYCPSFQVETVKLSKRHDSQLMCATAGTLKPAHLNPDPEFFSVVLATYIRTPIGNVVGHRAAPQTPEQGPGAGGGAGVCIFTSTSAGCCAGSSHLTSTSVSSSPWMGSPWRAGQAVGAPFVTGAQCVPGRVCTQHPGISKS